MYDHLISSMPLDSQLLSYRWASVPSGAATGVDENIYVAGLPKTFTKQQVEAIFAPYGRILNIKILVEPLNSHQSRGIAFVKYAVRADGDAAIQAMHGQHVEGAGAESHIQVR